MRTSTCICLTTASIRLLLVVGLTAPARRSAPDQECCGLGAHARVALATKHRAPDEAQERVALPTEDAAPDQECCGLGVRMSASPSPPKTRLSVNSSAVARA